MTESSLRGTFKPVIVDTTVAGPVSDLCDLQLFCRYSAPKILLLLLLYHRDTGRNDILRPTSAATA